VTLDSWAPLQLEAGSRIHNGLQAEKRQKSTWKIEKLPFAPEFALFICKNNGLQRKPTRFQCGTPAANRVPT